MNVTIREPWSGDAKELRRMVPMAHADMSEAEIDCIADRNGKVAADLSQLGFRSRRRAGIWIEADTLHTCRVADIGNNRIVGFSYAAPPIGWIFEQPTSVEEAKVITRHLVEFQLLAVLPKFRGRGIGSQLLTEFEDRYRAHGYRVALVNVDPSTGPLTVPWYQKHGYLFDELAPGQDALFDFGSHTARIGSGHRKNGQRFGFKVLAEPGHVTRHVPLVGNIDDDGATPPSGRPLISGLLHEETPPKQGNLP